MSPRPLPKHVSWLLRAVPSDWRDEVEGELAAIAERARRERGAVYAQAVLLREALDFAARHIMAATGETVRMGWSRTEWRVALRSLSRHPTVVALTLVTLSSAMTVAGGAFHLVQELLFSAPPFRNAEQVIDLELVDRSGGFPLQVSMSDIARIRTGVPELEQVGAWASRSELVEPPGGSPATRRVVFMTPDALDLLGVPPLIGAIPDLSEVRRGGSTVVLPHGLWQQWLAGEGGEIGRSILIAGRPHRVVAVMPEGFGFPYGEHLWVPLDPAAAPDLGFTRARIVGRMAVGASAASVAERLSALPIEALEGNEARFRIVETGQAGNRAPPPVLLWGGVLGLVAILFLMASNVGNLVLARNLRRSDELALRTALGASRARVVGVLFLEAVLLVAPATAAAAYLMSIAVPRLLGRLDDLPMWVDAEPGVASYAILLVLAVGVSVVLGLLPALGVTRDLGSAIRASGSGSPTRAFGLRTRLVLATQLALAVGFLSTVLTVGRALTGAASLEIPRDRVVLAQLYLGWPEELQDGRHLSASSRDSILAAFDHHLLTTRDELRAALASDPAVEAVVFASRWPGNESRPLAVAVEGGPTAPAVEIVEIESAYQDVLGLRPRIGRGLHPSDLAEGADPVALVNEPFVRAFISSGSPLGASVHVGGPDGQRYTVVGVVPEFGLSPGTSGSAPGIYLPLGPTNVLRVGLVHAGNPAGATAALFQAISQDPDRVRVQWTKTLEAQAREPLVVLWGFGGLLLSLGTFALILSAASLHAMTSVMVTSRTREIGVRVALGGTRGQVVRLVLGQSFGIGLGGIAAGMLFAVGLLGVVRTLPWIIDQQPVAGVVGLCALLAGAFAAAVWVPLHRALRIEPARAMRAE